MEIYKVGGCVRDHLLGIIPKDIDYVVVNSTPEQMLALGYEQVGADFPVFLHPESGDEYALARKERKTGDGYNGFSVDCIGISLEEDLFRRDLTINAIAMDNDGNIIDPFNGIKDLQSKTLRHVSDHFKEDPVRILRIARFTARYDFSIAPETLLFMKEMVNNNEFKNLTKERVWKEFDKALDEPHLLNFFNTLKSINALELIDGFSNDLELNYLNITKPDNSKFINSIYIYSQHTDLQNSIIPTQLKKDSNEFKYWTKNNYFYSKMTTEDKLLFIQKNKSLHDLTNSENIFKSIIQYLIFKNNDSNLDMQYELQQLHQDTASLKTIDYSTLINKTDKEANPKEIIRQAQIEALNKCKCKKNTNKP